MKQTSLNLRNVISYSYLIEIGKSKLYFKILPLEGNHLKVILVFFSFPKAWRPFMGHSRVGRVNKTNILT